MAGVASSGDDTPAHRTPTFVGLHCGAASSNDCRPTLPCTGCGRIIAAGGRGTYGLVESTPTPLRCLPGDCHGGRGRLTPVMQSARRREGVARGARCRRALRRHRRARRRVASTSAPARSCGLIGPNGAGKTTLFNCLSPALPLRARRHPVRRPARSLQTAHAPHRRPRHRPHVPEPGAVPHHDVLDNVMVGAPLPHVHAASSPTRCACRG